EQTAHSTGCTAHGVCGKDPETAALQDLLIHTAKGVSQYAHAARQLGVTNADLDHFVVEALFTTITNVNFDAAVLATMIQQGAQLRDRAKSLYENACREAGRDPEQLQGPAAFAIASDQNELVRQGEKTSIEEKLERLGKDAGGLQELILYGLKGMAAYVDHAWVLGIEDDDIYAFFHDSMDFLARDVSDVDALVGRALLVGEKNLRAMEMLDTANTSRYGHPEPTQARITPIQGKCILVSGHDLKDLDGLLKQTEGKGINVYTHGEMLPCLAYPELKKYKHLVGNYGGAWQDQAKEFDAFPGAILMTTNCIQKPRESYKNRIFTCGLVRWPNTTHISDGNFAAVIEAALAAPGFTEDAEEKSITIGFAHNTVLGVADKVIDAVKAGDIRHFFLIGGCDGAKSGRNYYTELATAVPDDCIIMTLACGKYRFNKQEFGDIGGIPRLLDQGQCNDAYSAIKIAVALAGAFECGVNDLPLSIVLSWYEQKAVCILLTLLHLNIQGIRIGPTLPAFVGPNVLNVLVEKFGLTPTGEAEADLKAMLG
ncbi:MAG: hydroxylamine reductase, partial [Candidatus Hydrogenedentes bacterium]|nr:hydroxylamine reductase [Candidatus Hydrogenedentota bacterium]